MPIYKQGSSEETKTKIRESNLGVKRSEETRERMRQAWLLRPAFGLEARQNMSASAKIRVKGNIRNAGGCFTKKEQNADCN